MTDLAKREMGLATMPAEMTIEELVARTRKVQEAMRAVMQEGEHYGVIPGTGSKPTLLKPGAEKLLNLFMLDPEYDAPPMYEDGGHLTIVSRCTLFHIPTGTRVGSGMGMCSTKEAKYAYRNQARLCPSCGKDAIIKGKSEYGGGWLCFKKKEGCGAKFKDGDGAIEDQVVGRIANEDKADQFNTVLKMANKRSLVAAVLNVTGASDIFTQDLEDLPAAPAKPAATDEPTPERTNAPVEAAADLFATPTEDEIRKLKARIQAGWLVLGYDTEMQVQSIRKECKAPTASVLDDVTDPAALDDLLKALTAEHAKSGKAGRKTV